MKINKHRIIKYFNNYHSEIVTILKNIRLHKKSSHRILNIFFLFRNSLLKLVLIKK